jgi:uncharacterized protein YjiS (DUF1127 family)
MIRDYCSSRWQSFKGTIRAWLLRACSRAELRTLDMGCGDFGFSRGTANVEASKPFWMA